MVDEGEAVGIVQVDEHALSVASFQIAEGGVVAKGTDVLHIAEQLLILACYGKGVERMLCATEGRMSQGDGAQRTCLARCLVVVEGDTVTEVPVEGGNEQGALLTEGLKDGIEELVAVEALTVTHAGEGELHDV